jgi:hypothetical protein
LPDAFTSYNDDIKSWNPAVNALKRVDVPKKTTLSPSIKKRGRAEIIRKDNASKKRPRKEKSKAPRKFKTVVQPDVEQHHSNADDTQSSSQARYINEIRTSEILGSLVFENHETSKGIEHRKFSTTIVDICFSTIIAENFLNDPDPKTMAECKKRSD